MFSVNKDIVIDELLLGKMLNRFKTNVQPQLQKYKTTMMVFKLLVTNAIQTKQRNVIRQ